MKPIKLMISGFNSFIERQTIDFTNITSHGMFGIFGPTGSGKSSILDAITFSLFNKTDRDSGDGAGREKTFININCKSAFVSFSFLINDDNYEIERVVNCKNGSYKTKSVKLIKNEEIISSKDSDIDTLLKNEVLGLEYKDFVTAVVLPQGKFSEFLKTTPAERRALIERLFDLKIYGTDLIGKIKNYSKKLELTYANLEGEFKSFNVVNEEDLNKKKSLYEEKLTEKDKIKEVLTSFIKEYNEIQNIWNISNEISSLKGELEKLQEKNSDIKYEEEKLNNYKMVKDLIPIKKKIYSEKKDLEELVKNKEDMEKQLLNLQEKFLSYNLKFEELSIRKIQDIPLLNSEHENLQSEMFLIDEQEKLNKGIKTLQNKLLKIKEEIEKLEEENKICIDKIDYIGNHLKEEEVKLKQNEVSEIYLNRIIKASEIENSYRKFIKNLSDVEKNISSLKENKENLDSSLALYECKSENLKVSLEYNEKQVAIMEKNIDIGRDAISSFTNKLNDLNSLGLQWERVLNNIKLSEEKVFKKNIDIEAALIKKRELEEEFKNLENLKNESAANKAIKVLMPILETEDKCPLCGSSPPFKNKAYIKDVEYDEKKFNHKAEELKKVNDIVIVYKTQIESFQGEIKDQKNNLNNISLEYNSIEDVKNDILSCKNLMEETKARLIEFQLERSKLLNDNLALKRDYERSISDLHETKGRIKITGDEMISREDERQKILLELKYISEEYDEEKLFFKSDDLKKLKEITMDMYKKYMVNFKNITDNRKLLDEFVLKKNTLAEKSSEKKLMSLRLKDEIDINFEKHASIALKLKFQSKDKLINRLGEIKSEIEKIEKEYIISANKIKEIESLKQDKISKLEKLKDMVLTKNNLLMVLENNLKENLMRLNLDNNIEEFEITKEEELELEKKINDFKKSYGILIQKISMLEEKINKVNISEERWQELNYKKENLEELKTKVEEETGALSKEIEIGINNLLKAQELKAKLDDLNKKKELVDEIKKVTSGSSSIMDFVAYKQLKYISHVASNTLSNITGSRYNIFIDDSGEFMIRDLLNGGEKRKIKSLSGGELFLTSLSMALALSSHIQLKGRMNLEFFFLDEGFGTLDKESLDIVLRALEKIKNNNLTIGIISHLKEIQDRMPVKIMVMPPNTDRGSVVKIM